MKHLRIIDNDEALEEALVWLDELMDEMPEQGTQSFDTLQVLAKLIEDYEKTRFPVDAVSPIDMIRFRMDQMGLQNKDLVPFLGSASKVSEVLSGKRGLSVSMIKSLSPALNIDPSLLLDIKSSRNKHQNPTFDTSLFPLADMFKLGYFNGMCSSLRETKMKAKELIEGLLSILPEHSRTAPAMLRASSQLESNERSINDNALLCWQARVLQRAKSVKLNTYDERLLTDDWVKRLVSLSCFDDGPRLAIEFLAKQGIHTVIEPHLKQTYLDGAVFRPATGNPVIALTLRHKGLDSFWFTLLHEIGHLKLHLTEERQWILDDLDSPSLSDIETEADDFASEALLPRGIFDTTKLQTATEVRALATKQCIAPEIVAGRTRHLTQNYKLFGKLFRRKVELNINESLR